MDEQSVDQQPLKDQEKVKCVGIEKRLAAENNNNGKMIDYAALGEDCVWYTTKILPWPFEPKSPPDIKP